MATPADGLAIPCEKPPGEVTVLVNHDLSRLYRDKFDRRFPHPRLVYVDSYDALPAAIAEARPDVVLSFKIHGGGRYPRESMLGALSIRWIHTGSAGVDHLAPWDATRLMVTNSGGIHAGPMAEYAAWAVLNTILRIPLYARQQAERRWKPHPTRTAGQFTAMVVGFGRIGEAIGRALRRLGLRVTGVCTIAGGDPNGAADRIIGINELPAAIGDADFVILALPRTPATIGQFDAHMIGRMKPGATLVNMARGGIVDEDALVRALNDGKLGAAVLDVAAEEPLPPGSPLWDAPGLIVTPHVSADIADWQVLAADLFADNLENWLAGRPVRNVCDPGRGY
jgi:phosphoglycerate dehydrogenase-like enzyme